MTVDTTRTEALEASTRRAEQAWLEAWIRGPQQTRWEALPIQPGDTAPDMTLLTHEGDDARISDFWSERPALVVFWRQFGCGCGVERAGRLRAELEQYHEAGANVVIIGQGDPIRAAAYRDQHELEVPILVDSDLSAYRAYGLREGSVAQILFDAPESFWDHDRETGENFIVSRRESGRPLVDNPWLLPGEFVVDATGTIVHVHRYQHCEDHPEPLVHVTAIKRASA